MLTVNTVGCFVVFLRKLVREENHWLTYVRHSYEVILEAESKLCVNLHQDLEAYMVHLFARYMDKPMVNKEPICIKILESNNLPKWHRRDTLVTLAEECLIIDGLQLGKGKWPTEHYYIDMGRIAYDGVAYVDRPPDNFYIELAQNFSLLSNLLNTCRPPMYSSDKYIL